MKQALLLIVLAFGMYSTMCFAQKRKKESDGFEWIEIIDNGKKGVKDEYGNVIVPPIYYAVTYRNASDFENNHSYLTDKAGHFVCRESEDTNDSYFVIYNKRGQILLRTRNRYSDIYLTYYIQYKKYGFDVSKKTEGGKKLYGLITPKTEGANPCVYEDISAPNTYPIKVKILGQWNSLSTSQTTTLLMGIDLFKNNNPYTTSISSLKGSGFNLLQKYENVESMKNGNTEYYKVSKGGRYGLTNAEGKEIVPCEMEALESAGTGYLKYKINGFWGVMNYAGKIIIGTDRGYTSIGNLVTFTKRFPYTMTGYKGECDINGRQISKIKVETSKQAAISSSSSSNSSSSNNSGNGTTQTVVVEHHRDPIPVQEWQACFGCGGMGTMGCDHCGGSGTKYTGDRLHRCYRCNGRGIIPCNICYGNKGQYITVYR